MVTITSTPRKLLMNLESIAEYYSSGDIAEKMLAFSAGREVAGRTSTGAYLSRPNILAYPDDIIRLVGEGAVSFHGSVERWSNPMSLSTGLARSELDRLRTGWDFLMDIDSDFLEYSKVTCDLLVKALRAHGVKSVFVKFSGRAGFHIAVPFEAFPKNVGGKPASAQFPDVPRTLATYLKEFIREQLSKGILALERNPDSFAKKIGKNANEVVLNGKLDPYAAVGIDTLLISPRHLVRLPYSLNEKSWLVSIPIEPSKVLEFERGWAKPSVVAVAARAKSLMEYCPAGDVVPEEASELVELALSHFSKRQKEDRHDDGGGGKTDMREELKFTAKLTEEYFPPCIRSFLGGIGDGRKRAEFVLRTFLRRAGWDWSIIEPYLLEWNRKKNREPLPDGYITSHVAWQKKQEGRTIMPPNCESAAFYKELGVCTPESFCNGAKNPIVVALRKSRIPTLKEKIPETKGRKAVGKTKSRKQKTPSPPTGLQ